MDSRHRHVGAAPGRRVAARPRDGTDYANYPDQPETYSSLPRKSSKLQHLVSTFVA
jgi:hypothetical protein